jgi:hypothetical protein
VSLSQVLKAMGVAAGFGVVYERFYVDSSNDWVIGLNMRKGGRRHGLGEVVKARESIEVWRKLLARLGCSCPNVVVVSLTGSCLHFTPDQDQSLKSCSTCISKTN